jgi:hypothetical protein
MLSDTRVICVALPCQLRVTFINNVYRSRSPFHGHKSQNSQYLYLLLCAVVLFYWYILYTASFVLAYLTTSKWFVTFSFLRVFTVQKSAK